MADGQVRLDEIKSILDVYAFAQERISHFEGVRDAARAEIEEALGNAEIGTVDGVAKITWKRGKTRRLDQRMLKERFPEVHSACVVEQQTRTFNTVKATDHE